MTYPSKPSSAPAIPFNSVGKSKVLNDIISAIGVEKLLALKTDGTYDDNFSIGDNSLNSLVNEINIRQGSTIKEYDSTGTNLLRTLTLGSATNLIQGFRYLDDPIKISNNATNPTTEIDVSAGIMTFDDGTGQVRLATSLTKSTANDFANGGLLPNGTVLQTNTWYYVFVIYSSASNLVSFYADTNYSSPTLPTSPNVYDKKSYRGAFYIDANGNIRGFSQYKNWFFFDGIAIDINEATSNFINGALRPITVPSIDVIANVYIGYTNDNGILLTSPNQDNDNNNGVDDGLNTFAGDVLSGGTTGRGGVGLPLIPTNNGQIRVRTVSSNGSVKVNTRGWIDNNIKF